MAAKAERVTAAQLEQEALAKADGASTKLKFYAQANNDKGLAAEQTMLQAMGEAHNPVNAENKDKSE